MNPSRVRSDQSGKPRTVPQGSEDAEEDDNAKPPPSTFHDAYLKPQGDALQSLTEQILEKLAQTSPRPQRRDAAARRDTVIANITANLASLVLTANHEPGRRLAISTAKDKPTRYDRKDWPQGIVSGTLDAMTDAGLIIRHRSLPRARQTTIEPTAAFTDLLSSHGVTLGDIGRDPGAESIWLMARTGEKGWADSPNPKERCDYEDTSASRAYRLEMEAINAHLNTAEITLHGASQGPAFLRRIFLLRHESEPGQPRRSRSRNFSLNGRLFGGFWENLSRHHRHGLRIEGEDVADLDFTAMFVNLAYARQALDLPSPEEAYRIPGLEKHRDGAKMGLISLLSRRGPMRQLQPDLKALLPDGWTARKFSDAAAAHHPAIVDLFGKDIGVELMFTESQILVQLLRRLNVAGITALPMHDGVMVPASRRADTLDAMREASERVTGIALPAREKQIARP